MALVLAIGIVVDDAIVMLENIMRRIEMGETPLVAAYKGAKQVSFAIVATTVVLVAVFIPLIFIKGSRCVIHTNRNNIVLCSHNLKFCSTYFKPNAW